MRTSELTGALLDYWVAKAGGVDAVMSDPHRNGSRNMVTFYGRDHDGKLDGRSYMPSAHWSDGGPIIESERIQLEFNDWHKAEPWSARKPYAREARGTTPLVAAMRAYVASKFGDEVDEKAPAQEPGEQNGADTCGS